MKKMPLALGMTLLGIACTISSAAAPKAVIVGKAKVLPGYPIWLDASKSTYDSKYPLKWEYKGPDVIVKYFDEGGKRGMSAFIPEAVAGVYEFKLKVKGVPEGETDVDIDVDTWTVVVDGQPGPTPTPTPTPVPTPTPTPTPDPGPAPAPISQVTDKLRVLFLYESGEPMPSIGAYEALRSPDIRAYLNTHTMTDGKLVAWRMWDKDVILAAETPGWTAALATAKAKVPPVPAGQPFVPLAFAFKDTELLDVVPVTDPAILGEWLKKYGGR